MSLHQEIRMSQGDNPWSAVHGNVTSDDWAVRANKWAFGGELTAVADTPRAVLWRRVGQRVHDLPRNYPHRAFLVDFAELAYVDRARRRHGLGRERAEAIVARFCERVGLDAAALGCKRALLHLSRPSGWARHPRKAN